MDKRYDEEWRQAATKYRQAKMALEDAQQEERDAKAILLELTEVDAAGCGVEVKFTERRGSIDYAKFIKDTAPDADLEPYRKKSASVTTVKASKE